MSVCLGTKGECSALQNLRQLYAGQADSCRACHSRHPADAKTLGEFVPGACDLLGLRPWSTKAPAHDPRLVRAPKKAAGNAEYLPVRARSGNLRNLRGLRYLHVPAVSLYALVAAARGLLPQAQPSIT